MSGRRRRRASNDELSLLRVGSVRLPACLIRFCCEKLGAMPTLAVGMLITRGNGHMPTASVGMAPVPRTFRSGN